MPATATISVVGVPGVRWDNVPVVGTDRSGAAEVMFDTRLVPNSTPATPTRLSGVVIDPAGNPSPEFFTSCIVNNPLYGGGVPPLSPEGFRVRNNSTRVSEGDGLRVTAVAGGTEMSVDNNIVGKLMHVVAGTTYDLSCLYTLAAGVTGTRVGDLSLEWLAMGSGEDGYGGALLSFVAGTATAQPGVERSLYRTGIVAPANAARARFILRTQHNATSSPVAAGDSALFRQLRLDVAGAADTTAPTGSFTSPASGATVQGVVPIRVQYQD